MFSVRIGEAGIGATGQPRTLSVGRAGTRIMRRSRPVNQGRGGSSFETYSGIGDA